MIYLYGLVSRGTEAPPARGVGGGAPALLPEGPVAALVSRLPNGDHRATKDDLLAHSDVLQRVVDGGDAVLPIRFGTTFRDEDELRSGLLEPNAAVLADMLDRMRGKVEVQVKATYVEDAVVARAVAGDRRIQRLKRSSHLDARVELGRRVAENIERQRYSDARLVVDVLGKHAEATSLGDAAGEYGLVNASFLVDRTRLGAFDETFEHLRARTEDLVTFRYVGPLPPYSFVDASALTVARWA